MNGHSQILAMRHMAHMLVRPISVKKRVRKGHWTRSVNKVPPNHRDQIACQNSDNTGRRWRCDSLRMSPKGPLVRCSDVVRIAVRTATPVEQAWCPIDVMSVSVMFSGCSGLE